MTVVPLVMQKPNLKRS